MRDLLVSLIVFASLPFIVGKPVRGVLMWVWISVMNPHTQGWGYATDFPFAMIVAVTTLASLPFARESKSLPLTGVSLALLLFALWMNVTLPFSIFYEASLEQWAKVMKIMLMTVAALMLVKSERDIGGLIWILSLSLAFYGIKGGLFTLRDGGADRVWGPPGTFIDDNNALALALVMTIPLLHYLQLQDRRRWMRYVLGGASLLCALAALGSYSRGAFLAIAAMLLHMWLRSRQKMAVGSVLAVATPLFLLFMPSQWASRMDSIHDYAADSSAMGRINAWQMAWHLAQDRFFGGGFEIYEPSVFLQYAPDPLDVHAAHSIYFQIMGEHGFVGLGLYLCLAVATWRCASWIIRRSQGLATLAWAGSLASTIQTSLVGFAVGGAFLSLAYFDVPYYLMVALVATRALVEKQLALPAPQADAVPVTEPPS